MRSQLLFAWLAVAASAVGCHQERDVPRRHVPAASSSVKPIDRLAPGELAPSPTRVFGFDVPKGMTVRGQFAEVAYLHGDVRPEALANYVRERVAVEHVEIGAARTVFPNARIKKGPPDRVYQIEVIAVGRRTELVITDVTPRTVAPEPLSEEERWRRAGRRPDGKPFDITELK